MLFCLAYGNDILCRWNWHRYHSCLCHDKMMKIRHTRIGGNQMKKQKKDLLKVQDAKKDAGNNQWTNANLKYYPDERERHDGPGGE